MWTQFLLHLCVFLECVDCCIIAVGVFRENKVGSWVLINSTVRVKVAFCSSVAAADFSSSVQRSVSLVMQSSENTTVYSSGVQLGSL